MNKERRKAVNIFMRSAALAIALVFLCAPPLARATDYSITPGSVIASAQARKVTGTAGATITAGQLVYLDPVTNTYKLADANGASPLYKVAGIALNGASSGQRITVCTSDPSFTPGTAVNPGEVFIASATPGGIAPFSDAATGWFVTVLGPGIGSNKIKLDPFRSNTAK